MCDGTIRVQDLPERVRNYRPETATPLVSKTEPEKRADAPQEWPSLAEVEGRYVAQLLEHTRGNKQAASRLLGVDRKTLDRMIKRHNINFGNVAHFPLTSRPGRVIVSVPGYHF
jgi:transcriptional regulator of acetoin/glycerol metabolism